MKATGKNVGNAGKFMKDKIKEKAKLIANVLLKNIQYNFNSVMTFFCWMMRTCGRYKYKYNYFFNNYPVTLSREICVI
jgi:hypothetical protein